jgi:hypothetical protein
MKRGIVYSKSGERERGRIAGYHSKPSPRFHNQTPYREDIAGLKPIAQRDSIASTGRAYKSKYTIGFEVEKNQFHRDAVEEYELFCGFETDSSCGYEAVTNVLPLLPAGEWRTKVYDMMVKAERIIDSRYSPADNRCSCHTTITVSDNDGCSVSAHTVRERIREYVSIVMALYRNRLTNHYCNLNLTMLPMDQQRNWINISSQTTRYQFGLCKVFPGGSEGIEFRAVSKVKSVKGMMRRYELFYEIVNYAMTHEHGNLPALLKIVRPIILSMYNGDEAKVDAICKLSKHFRDMIVTNKINEHVGQWVDPNHEQPRHWKRGAWQAYQARMSGATPPAELVELERGDGEERMQSDGPF